jgi:hypothetical protein
MARFVEKVRLVGRCGVIAVIHAEKAARMEAAGQAVRIDKRSIRASCSLEDEALLPVRKLTSVSPLAGQRYSFREQIWGGVAQCVACAGSGCEICDDRGHMPAISGHTVAFRRIDPEDAPLFRLTVTDCLSA